MLYKFLKNTCSVWYLVDYWYIMVILNTNDWRNCEMYNKISGKELLKIAFIKFFTNNFVNAFVNILIPCILSIHCTKYTNDKQWWVGTIFLLIIIVFFNILSAIII